MTLILGVTGGIATGKSTVSAYFGKLGYPVIDSDSIARQVVAPGSEGLAKLVATFGEEVRQKDGTLDRQKLGKLVFGNEEKRHLLDQLLDTDIRQTHVKEIQGAIATGVALVVVDIPLLYEAHYEEMVDVIMVVSLPVEEQITRLRQRNHLSEEEALARLNSQWPLEKKVALADVVIDNSGDLTATYAQIDSWLQKNI